MEELRADKLISNNQSLAGYNLNEQFYRAKSIELRQPFILPGFKKTQVMEMDFKGTLPFDLIIKGLRLDISEDDKDVLGEGELPSRNFNFTFLRVQIINRKNSDVEDNVDFFISTFPSILNELILTTDVIYRFSSNRDLNKITIYGEPTYLREPIVFTSAKEITDS